ncbi:MAG TPA: DUF481 domain-containing protein [Thermoanaerobaculaceae bacterium]|nr:DUF481 domain-containing protein [Thermoanaerobaculaceae bacterium]
MNRLGMLFFAVILVSSAVAAEDSGKPWNGSFGLSYLATSGNSDTSSLGIEVTVKRKPAPWGIDLSALVLRAEKDGVKSAERVFGRARGERALTESWGVFLGASAEKDRFAGLDLRGVLEAGGSYKMLTGPEHELSLEAGVTFTREERTSGIDDDFLGGLAGLAYTWIPMEGAKVSERLLVYPSFDRSSDWRLVSETALQAALTKRFSLKIAYALRYDHEPPPGFDSTDTATTASLVWSF